jgi:hypothetical protein
MDVEWAGQNERDHRPRCGSVDNIEVALREVGWCCMDWIDIFRDRGQ